MVAPEDPRFHTADRWQRETGSTTWAERVVEVIDRRLKAAGSVVHVESIDVAENVLVVRYRHTAVGAPPGGYGLRRRLDHPPPVGEPVGDLAAWLGGWIAEYELIEPAGGSAGPPDDTGRSWRTVPDESPSCGQ